MGIAVSEYRDATDLLLNKSPETMTTVMFASDFTNNAEIEACQPTQSFGGGACEPDTTTIDLFNAQNAFRMNPTAVDRLKHGGYTNAYTATDTVDIEAGYKLNPVMQRLHDLSQDDYWGQTYNVFAWDINNDDEWHGS